MAKPDMSRNKDLAGKTVSKGGYNISYNENGYATSAIKTGSKTGKAAALSVDKVQKATEGMQIVKTILVKNRLINLIVKPR